MNKLAIVTPSPNNNKRKNNESYSSSKDFNIESNIIAIPTIKDNIKVNIDIYENDTEDEMDVSKILAKKKIKMNDDDLNNDTEDEMDESTSSSKLNNENLSIINHSELIANTASFLYPSPNVISKASNSKAIMLVLCGLPGAGKSTLAATFSNSDEILKRKWEVACQDVLKSRL